MNPITSWGISTEAVKHFFGKRVAYSKDGDTVKCGYLSLRNLQSDCGAVVMSNIGIAADDSLKDAIEYCRLSGYSLLVGTVTDAENIPRLEALGFVCKLLGLSHRHPEYSHYLVHYHIPEDKFQVKGYQQTGVPK